MWPTGEATPEATPTTTPQPVDTSATPLPPVDASVDPPGYGPHLLRAVGAHSCVGWSSAEGLATASCDDAGARFVLRAADGDYRLGIATGGTDCLVPDGVGPDRGFTAGSCDDPAAAFRFDAVADEVFRIRSVAGQYCLALAGDRVVQQVCRGDEVLQHFTPQPLDG
ncbi:hypothetical protein GCM10023223_42400 [Stackebrandtia albiflava]